MTRKHFEKIAQTIRNLDVDPDTRRHVAERFADLLAADNGNFKRDLFLAACKV